MKKSEMVDTIAKTTNDAWESLVAAEKTYGVEHEITKMKRNEWSTLAILCNDLGIKCIYWKEI